jgi:hypothetical protein
MAPETRSPTHLTLATVRLPFCSLLLAVRPPSLSLFRRRTIWCPTWAGLLCFGAILLMLVAGWVNSGEQFLELTKRLPADVLVVEGWISREGVRAAVAEFQGGGYHYIVASGGLTSGRWGEDEPASYAKMAADEMIRLGIPKEKIVVATADYTENHRTFESATAVWRVLRSSAIRPQAVNVFTFGPHARRSALVFAKVFSPGISVGIIAWTPPEYRTEPWWRSSERSRELLQETVGFLYEFLLNSGRATNSPMAGALALRTPIPRVFRLVDIA